MTGPWGEPGAPPPVDSPTDAPANDAPAAPQAGPAGWGRVRHLRGVPTPGPDPAVASAPATPALARPVPPSAPLAPPAAPDPTSPVRLLPGVTAPAVVAAPPTVGVQPAASSAAAAAPAAAATAAAAASPTPVPPFARRSVPRDGTLHGGPDTPGADRPRRGWWRGLSRLRIGSHVVSDAALTAMTPPAATGLVLGHDADRDVVSIRLFRPEPTRVALVGGPWLCQLVIFRALALGARVAIFTSATDRWRGFGEWATGRADRVAVLPADQVAAVPASPREPALLVYDTGLLGPSAPAPLGPWQTQLTVLSQFTAYGIPVVQEATLVMLQRLASTEVEVAAPALRLNPDSARLLQVMTDDMLALLGGDANRYLWLTPSTVEQQSFGASRR